MEPGTRRDLSTCPDADHIAQWESRSLPRRSLCWGRPPAPSVCRELNGSKCLSTGSNPGPQLTLRLAAAPGEGLSRCLPSKNLKLQKPVSAPGTCFFLICIAPSVCAVESDKSKRLQARLVLKPRIFLLFWMASKRDGGLRVGGC